MPKRAEGLRTDIERLLREERLGVLATQGERYPYATLVGFSFSRDLKFVSFATLRETRKYRNIEADPQVSILIDTRKNYIDDFKSAVAMTILGSASELRGETKRRHARLFLKRFPNLKDFIEDPDTALVGIRVVKYILVSRFQEVKELPIPPED